MSGSVISHPFVANVISRFEPSVKRAVDYVAANKARSREARAENRARMSPAERYNADVFQRVSGLLGTIRAVEDSQRLIGIFPSHLAKGRHAISRDRWVDYHYGVFTVSLASIPDIAVVLAAAVHRLGLAHRYCTYGVVASHQYISGTETEKCLKAIVKAVAAMKGRRHAHVHRGELADVAEIGEEANDNFLFHTKAMSFIEAMKPGATDRALMRASWREAVRSIVPQLEAEAAAIEPPLASLFTALEKPFILSSDWLAKQP